jgi:iron complex outermembrane receptor protein
MPKSERTTGLIKATVKINENHELGIEFLSTQSKVQSAIAPVPYGGLYINRLRPDGTPNPYFSIRRRPRSELHGRRWRRHPGRPAWPSCTRWRDLPNGARADENINKQQRLVSMNGVVAGWDYRAP